MKDNKYAHVPLSKIQTLTRNKMATLSVSLKTSCGTAANVKMYTLTTR